MSMLIDLKQNLKSPEYFQGLLLNKFGIGAHVEIINNKPAIKVYNHFSLFTVTTKIRHDFDFTVYHKKEKNHYIIYLNI